MPRWIYLVLGHFFVAVGVAGFFLPLLPGTPLLLVAAFCYSRGSAKLERWLITHPRLGPPILSWRQRGAISRKAKTLAILGLSISWLITVNFANPPLWGIVSMSVCMVSVAVFILTRPH